MASPAIDNTIDDKPTFEKVWAMFQETDRKFEKLMKETDKKFRETDKLIGDLGHRFGELAEHMVAPSIMEKFNELGFEFDKSSQDIEIKDPSNYAEIDILLENGDIAVAVEVKAKAKQRDVDDHLVRMEKLRRNGVRRHDNRKLRGAIAAAIMTEEVREYALQKGFYVIVQTGDTVRIDIPKGFIPREW